jgi:hypothetical protein
MDLTFAKACFGVSAFAFLRAQIDTRLQHSRLPGTCCDIVPGIDHGVGTTQHNLLESKVTGLRKRDDSGSSQNFPSRIFRVA